MMTDKKLYKCMASINFEFYAVMDAGKPDVYEMSKYAIKEMDDCGATDAMFVSAQAVSTKNIMADMPEDWDEDCVVYGTDDETVADLVEKGGW